MTYLNILLLNLLQESSIIRVLILLIVLKEMRNATQQPRFNIKAVINIIENIGCPPLEKDL